MVSLLLIRRLGDIKLEVGLGNRVKAMDMLAALIADLVEERKIKR